MLAMFNGQPIFGPRGPAGPDGNPIGTVISYMGTKAPTDYLICDGSIYNISDYSKLAEFFKTQFGSENYFGGDGTTTFAVPDMRNLFLRGFHGDSEEQLSGDVGVRQEGTEHVYVEGYSYSFYNGNTVKPNKVDTFGPSKTQKGTSYTGGGESLPDYYTSRPVNMAVLYCIKAIPSQPILEEYDTEDGWHVRKYSDGYVEMVYSKEYNITKWAISDRLFLPDNSTGFRWLPEVPYPLPLVMLFSIIPSAYYLNGVACCGASVTRNQNDELTSIGGGYLWSQGSTPGLCRFMVTVTGRWK